MLLTNAFRTVYTKVPMTRLDMKLLSEISPTNTQPKKLMKLSLNPTGNHSFCLLKGLTQPCLVKNTRALGNTTPAQCYYPLLRTTRHRALCYTSYVISLVQSLPQPCGNGDYSCFTEEERDTQIWQVTCTKSHNQ